MAWIESHTVLIRHRKLTSTAHALRLKPVYLLGHLHALWHTVLEQQEDGDLSSWDDDSIANAACYGDSAAKFVSLLLSHKWLDDARTIHDWLDYAGLYLIRKYAKRNKPRLAEIWAKHGKVYGQSSQKSQEPSNDLATTKQQSFVGGVGVLDSKDSSIMEGREFFNPGLHVDLASRAKAVIAYYFVRVAPSRLSTAAVAERLLAQVFLDEPTLQDDAILAGIDHYAKECANEKPSMRSSPKKFIENRSWESYDGRVKTAPPEKTARERAAESAKQLPI